MGLNMYLERQEKKCEVGTWKSAYAINEWFSDHCTEYGLENGVYVEIDKDTLLELKSDCEKVLKDHSLAKDLIPQPFSNDPYDEAYFDDLRDTIKIIDYVIATTDFGIQQIVYSKW